MSKLLFLGVAVLALAVFGCSSNPAGSDISGPAAPATTGTSSLGLPVDVPPEVEYTGFYGAVSNLNLGAGSFTLTSPSGNTLDVAATPGAKVLYQGTFYDLASSPLEDGMNVSVTPYVSGLPEGAKIRATLIVINSSPTNKGLLAVD